MAVGDVGLEPAHLSKQEVEVTEGAKESTQTTKEEQAKSSQLPFIHGFIASLCVIIISEIGDKTFFIAAILAMQHSKLLVFSGAILSLGKSLLAWR